MRVWDCDPSHLSRRHLGAEHYEIHTLWRAIEQRHAGSRKGYASHSEARRFEHARELLVARHDYVICEGARRGYNFVSRPEGSLAFRVYAASMAWDDFIAFGCDWPLLEGGPWTPWKRDGVTYDEYRATERSKR